MPTIDLTLNELDLLRVVLASVNRPVNFTTDGMHNHAEVTAKVAQAIIDASMSALPAGWKPTTDGVNALMNATTGAASWSRTFEGPVEGDTAPIVEAPCGPNGEITAETVQAIHGWDLERKGFKPVEPVETPTAK